MMVIPYTISAVLFLVVGAAIAGYFVTRRRRRTAIDAVFAEEGFLLVRTPEAAAKTAAWTVFAPMKHLKHGAKGVEWVARGRVDGREVVAMRHSYIISTGQSAQRIVHWCVACRCPEDWPMVELRGEHLLHRLADALGGADLRLENEAFNRRWRVSAEIEDQAILVLTPEVQAMLVDAPSGESWSIGRGWCRMSGRKLGRPEQLRTALHRPVGLLKSVPPELLVEESPG